MKRKIYDRLPLLKKAERQVGDDDRDARMVNIAFNTTESGIGLGLKRKEYSLKFHMNNTFKQQIFVTFHKI